MGLFNKFSDQISGVGKNISNSTQQFVNETKIQASIREKKNTINEALLNLGKAYYTAHADDKDSEFAGTIEAIRSEYKSIDELKRQLSDVRGKTICPKCGAEIDKDVAFCPKCGANLAEAAKAEKEKETAAPEAETPADAPKEETAAADETKAAEAPADGEKPQE
ncbi:MAG: zinc ribbon domain-containing protein [Lachnospiraceae bacterium]|jgi:hypothetical protein|nr:zinc ribbon domain-containing protein [Lachnospiraceae bacterium]MCH4030580.1 zinc ribbon domain-containing protein [Lachnospiraceae bacterium]MCH4069789.1 zinc ribbon domain-containing protein [Lachnospiraceae bacterium]MCH4107272.1 zinc ribbon domain-containing protein [Lachnospiraceae bacterium]MCI1301873.1 zinc ribbon domain-containing protein [Lachnospiraceae bacterium]